MTPQAEATWNPGADAPPEYFEALARQRGFILVFVLSAMLTSLGLTYAFSEKYESYTMISYRVQEVTRFKPLQNEAMGSPAPQAPFKVIGQTLQEVAKSDAILEDVVRTLRLDEKRSGYEGPWYKVWYQKAKDWAIEKGQDLWMLLKYGRILDEDPTAAAVRELRNNVKIMNRDSYIFTLSVRDKYPERAAKITDYVAKVLAAWLLEYDRHPGRTRLEQLRALLGDKNRELEQRRKEIESLLAGNRLGSVQLETERMTDSLSALRLEESRLASDIARARTRQAEVQAKLQVKQRILSGHGTAADSAEFIPPEDFRKLASQGLFDDMELKSMLAKQASLQSSIDALTARLQKQPGIQNRLDTLKLELGSLEREFTLLSDGVQEAEVRASSAVSEVSVLHPAPVPSNPVSPIKVYHVALSGVLALLVACGLVYLLEFLRIGVLFAVRPAGPREPPNGAPQPSPDEASRNG